MNFTYSAKSVAGETATGSLTADTLVQARQLLRDKGLFVLSLAADKGRGAGGPRRRGKRIGQRDILALTSQLAIMSRAGMDIAGALESLVRQCSHPKLKAVLAHVHQDVMGGKSVSAALRNQAHVFGPTYVASVAAGEASGKLPEVLNRLAALQRSELRLRGTLRTLLAYPIVLASVSLLVICGLVFFVLPQFDEVFSQFEMPLPAITQALLAVSTELRTRFWLWGALGVAGMGGLVWLRKSETGVRLRDRFVLNAVFVRDVTRSLLIGRAFRLLGLMVDSGVPLLDGLRLTRSSLPNLLFRQLFDDMERDVLNGRGLAGALAEAPFVPPSAAEMVLTAERTGSLAMVAQTMGEFYEEEGETRMRELATILEPLIIIGMGAFVAVVVLSVMLPMFDFATFAERKG